MQRVPHQLFTLSGIELYCNQMPNYLFFPFVLQLNKHPNRCNCNGYKKYDAMSVNIYRRNPFIQPCQYLFVFLHQSDETLSATVDLFLLISVFQIDIHYFSAYF